MKTSRAFVYPVVAILLMVLGGVWNFLSIQKTGSGVHTLGDWRTDRERVYLDIDPEGHLRVRVDTGPVRYLPRLVLNLVQRKRVVITGREFSSLSGWRLYRGNYDGEFFLDVPDSGLYRIMDGNLYHKELWGK